MRYSRLIYFVDPHLVAAAGSCGIVFGKADPPCTRRALEASATTFCCGGLAAENIMSTCLITFTKKLK